MDPKMFLSKVMPMVRRAGVAIERAEDQLAEKSAELPQYVKLAAGFPVIPAIATGSKILGSAMRIAGDVAACMSTFLNGYVSFGKDYTTLADMGPRRFP